MGGKPTFGNFCLVGKRAIPSGALSGSGPRRRALRSASSGEVLPTSLIGLCSCGPHFREEPLLSLTIVTAAALGLADPVRSAFAKEAAAPSPFSKPVPSPFSQALQWRLIGPFRGGRVTAVAGHADEPNVYYMGAAGGGVWKTEDAGQTWHNVSDGFLRVGTIGAIA